MNILEGVCRNGSFPFETILEFSRDFAIKSDKLRNAPFLPSAQ